jgi:hypothetical protein
MNRLTVTALLLLLGIAWAGNPAPRSLAGTWQGELDEVPAVTLTLRAVPPGEVAGMVVFYMIQNGVVAGEDKHLLIQPRLEGRRLSFRVIPPDIRFEVTFESDNAAVMKRLGDDPLVVRLKKTARH